MSKGASALLVELTHLDFELAALPTLFNTIAHIIKIAGFESAAVAERPGRTE